MPLILKLLRTWLIACLISGCTMKLAYDNMDIIIAWETDNYFDLLPEQKKFIRNRVQFHLLWHRQQELGRYIDYLIATRERLRGGLVKDDLDWFFSHYQQFQLSLIDRTVEDTAAFLASVDDKQREHLQQALLEYNEELEDKLELSREERLTQRSEKIIERLEQWTGELSDSQQQKISELTFQLPDMTEAWLRYRQQRQTEFQALVRLAAKTDITPTLRDWLVRPLPPQFKRLEEKIKTTILAVDRLLTDKQRQHFIEEISELINDIEKLSRTE